MDHILDSDQTLMVAIRDGYLECREESSLELGKIRGLISAEDAWKDFMFTQRYA